MILCDRCGARADEEWLTVGTYSDPDAVIRGRTTCTTPGCVDEDGSRSVYVEIDGELTREDHRWLKAQRRFLAEYERVERALSDAVKGW